MREILPDRPDAGQLRIAIVAARFNDFITQRLLEGAAGGCLRTGVLADNISHVWVPGSFEVPLTAQKLAESGRFCAVVCVGCLIRGETPHFDYIAGAVTQGIAQVSRSTGIPVTFGVLTVDTLEQAIDRAGGKHGNKGAEAAQAALEMVGVLRGIGKIV